MNKPQKISKSAKIIDKKDTTLENNKICLFCNQMSDSFENNIEHMKAHHTFFIIDEEFCVDKE